MPELSIPVRGGSIIRNSESEKGRCRILLTSARSLTATRRLHRLSARRRMREKASAGTASKSRVGFFLFSQNTPFSPTFLMTRFFTGQILPVAAVGRTFSLSQAASHSFYRKVIEIQAPWRSSQSKPLTYGTTPRSDK